MTIETIRDSLCINQIVEQRKDSFIIEGDAIIPDVKPDILGTISTSGTVCIYKKEIQDGKIKIDGTINTYIMYLADSESNNIRSINTNLDFSQTINTEKAKINMNLENTFTLKEIECKVLNGRKVNIKAVLEVETKMFSNENIDIVKGVEDLRDVQTLNNNININTFPNFPNASADFCLHLHRLHFLPAAFFARCIFYRLQTLPIFQIFGNCSHTTTKKLITP